MAFKHGITLIEVADGPRTLTAVSTTVIGLFAIPDDADPATFPLDRPALITDVETAIGKAGARAMGLRALIDTQTGQHKTLSNVAVEGVVGLTKDIYWDIEDQASEPRLLNAKEITALIRTDSGYRFWGNRTTAEPDILFVFESPVRVTPCSSAPASGYVLRNKAIHIALGVMADGTKVILGAVAGTK